MSTVGVGVVEARQCFCVRDESVLQRLDRRGARVGKRDGPIRQPQAHLVTEVLQRADQPVAPSNSQRAGGVHGVQSGQGPYRDGPGPLGVTVRQLRGCAVAEVGGPIPYGVGQLRHHFACRRGHFTAIGGIDAHG